MRDFHNRLQQILDEMSVRYREQSHASLLSSHIETARDLAVRADELDKFSIVLESTYKKFKEL